MGKVLKIALLDNNNMKVRIKFIETLKNHATNIANDAELKTIEKELILDKLFKEVYKAITVVLIKQTKQATELGKESIYLLRLTLSVADHLQLLCSKVPMKLPSLDENKDRLFLFERMIKGHESQKR